MVFTIEVAVILALLIGAAGGFISSIASWLSTTDPFSTRKNIKGILTGIFAGLALGVVAIGTLTAEMPFTRRLSPWLQYSYLQLELTN